MIEVLLNDVTLEGMRRVKVVSDAPIDPATLTLPSPFKGEGDVRTWSDDLLGLHYLEATWACREAVKIRCEGWTCARNMVLWKLAQGERVSLALKQAVYAWRFKSFPAYAFMKTMPKTIENGFEAEEMVLFEAEWVPAGCIAICEGEHYGFEAVAMQK